MAEQTFTIYTDNHVATVGANRFEFEPEVDTPFIMEGLAALRRGSRERDKAREESDATSAEMSPIEKQAADAKDASDALRGFLASLMVPESAAVFADTKLPDRVLLELQQWALGVYGLRPTGPSSDSAELSATTPDPGSGSMGTSPSEE